MPSPEKSKFPLVVIIGGGFGGLRVARQLEDKPVEVLMLDKHNYHTFQPLLYQVFVPEKFWRPKKFPFPHCRSIQSKRG
jgi:flavin-dependent dehydrogenase